MLDVRLVARATPGVRRRSGHVDRLHLRKAHHHDSEHRYRFPEGKSRPAYSGGLDTSVCIKWLQEKYDFDVIAVVGDLGQEHDGLEAIKAKALKTGRRRVPGRRYARNVRERVLDLRHGRQRHVREQVPAGERSFAPLIAKHLVDAAHAFGAKYIAHGCTGKGNDQVRFESSITMLDPDITIIAPVRDWDLGSRPEEMEWAAAHGIDVPTTQASPYSIDDNLWGRAIECGVLEDPWCEPPTDIYTMTVDPLEAPDAPTYVEIAFDGGVPLPSTARR